MRVLAALCLFCLSLGVFAQEEEEGYTTENSFGFTLNTNSGLPGGIVYKYAKLRSDNTYQIYSIELVGIKHPKEFRQSNQSNTAPFVYDKLNYFYSLRPQYGREMVLFQKAPEPESGLQISAFVLGGPSIGILKPYYIEYQYDPNDPNSRRIVPYDPLVHTDTRFIIRSAGVWYGFDKLSIVPGVHVKAGLSFEFGAFKHNITGFSTGFTFEAFPEKILIMSRPQNRSTFTAAFLTFFFGSRK
jgi:hypothetical protein